MSSGLIQEAIDLFIDNQLSDETRRAYRTDINKWSEFLDGREPTERIALDFRAHLEKTVSSASAARTFNTCRAYYRHAKGDNPFSGVKSTRRLRNALMNVPERSDINQMFAACTNLRDAAVLVLLTNGLRASEVSDLKLSGWKWSEAHGVWMIAVTGKGYKQRSVVANVDTARIVNQYLAQFSRGTTYLIRAKAGHRLSSRSVGYIVKKYAPDLHPHSLRHFWITELIRKGASVFAVQKQVGHESVSTTERYVHFDMTDTVNEMKKFGTLEEGLKIVHEDRKLKVVA